MKRLLVAAVVALSSLTLADPPPQAKGAPPAKADVKADVKAEPTPAPKADAAKPAAPAGPKPVMAVTTGLSTPESVLYDDKTDTYLVSNINGSPLDKDNNGYITELSPDGAVVKAKLVAGGENGVTLNAPKGLALSNGLLFVADLDTVRWFDRSTGAPKGELKVAGSTFVNDLAVGPDGLIYLSDSGLKGGKDGFAPTGTDGVYAIDVSGKKAKLKTVKKDKALARPNGLLVQGDTLYMVPFGANTLHAFDLKAKAKAKGEATKLPTGGLDGLVAVGDEFLVSSWEGKAVYRGKVGGEFKEVLGGLEAPADIGFDTKRSRVLVPRFMGNAVEAYELK